MVIPSISDQNKEEIIHSILEEYNKELDVRVVDVIVKKTHSGNPLYLRLLLERLSMLNLFDFVQMSQQGDNEEAIVQYEIALLKSCPDTLHQICTELLQQAAKRFSDNNLNYILQYLALSRNGLSERDLEGMFRQNGK